MLCFPLHILLFNHRQRFCNQYFVSENNASEVIFSISWNTQSMISPYHSVRPSSNMPFHSPSSASQYHSGLRISSSLSRKIPYCRPVSKFFSAFASLYRVSFFGSLIHWNHQRIRKSSLSASFFHRSWSSLISSVETGGKSICAIAEFFHSPSSQSTNIEILY